MADYSTSIANLKAALEEATANPSPNYSINGQSVNYADYIAMLVNSLKELEELQAVAPAEGGPFIIKKRSSLR